MKKVEIWNLSAAQHLLLKFLNNVLYFNIRLSLSKEMFSLELLLEPNTSLVSGNTV